MPKLKSIFRVVPAIILWILWRRGNFLKPGGAMIFTWMVIQTQEAIKKSIKSLSLDKDDDMELARNSGKDKSIQAQVALLQCCVAKTRTQLGQVQHR